MIGKILDIIGKTSTGSKDAQKIDQAALEEELAKILMMEGSPPAEPDLRTLGLFSDVTEERIAELIHAMLYLDEYNRSGREVKPIKFYISTYGGSADDMFGMYDIMRTVRETTEIHTVGIGKVMSAGVNTVS